MFFAGEDAMHKQIEPAIHYWGTPVVLVSTLNEDGSVNLAPMSSAWWLGYSCMLGFDASSQTVRNLERERECVLNLPSADMAEHVNRLALTTGSRSVPLHKKMLGYESVPDKLGRAQMTVLPSVEVRTPRVAECPVQLEAVLANVRAFGRDDPRMAVPARAIEVRIVRVHVAEELMLDDDRVDPHKWKPLIMSFRHLFGLGPAAERSVLAKGDESMYAPGKRGIFIRAAAKGLRAFAERRYGLASEDVRDES
jgi:flavin reductase (DIM6/NTAB) family NADH-FMN oxidoreductase RutF